MLTRVSSISISSSEGVLSAGIWPQSYLVSRPRSTASRLYLGGGGPAPASRPTFASTPSVEGSITTAAREESRSRSPRRGGAQTPPQQRTESPRLVGGPVAQEVVFEAIRALLRQETRLLRDCLQTVSARDAPDRLQLLGVLHALLQARGHPEPALWPGMAGRGASWSTSLSCWQQSWHTVDGAASAPKMWLTGPATSRPRL